MQYIKQVDLPRTQSPRPAWRGKVGTNPQPHQKTDFQFSLTALVLRLSAQSVGRTGGSFIVAPALFESLEPKSATWHSYLISQPRGFPQDCLSSCTLSFSPVTLLSAEEGVSSLVRDTEVCWSHGGLCGFLSRICEPLLAAHLDHHIHRSALRWHWVLKKQVASCFIWYYSPLFWPLAQLVIWLLPKPTGSLTS